MIQSMRLLHSRVHDYTCTVLLVLFLMTYSQIILYTCSTLGEYSSPACLLPPSTVPGIPGIDCTLIRQSTVAQYTVATTESVAAPVYCSQQYRLYCCSFSKKQLCVAQGMGSLKAQNEHMGKRGQGSRGRGTIAGQCLGRSSQLASGQLASQLHSQLHCSSQTLRQ